MLTCPGQAPHSESYMVQAQEADAAKRSQAMAEAGDVDGSMVCAQQAEAYRLQHDTLHTQLTAPERVMTVCEVCGVFINSTDNDQRRQVRKMSEVRRSTAPPQLQMLMRCVAFYACCLCSGLHIMVTGSG